MHSDHKRHVPYLLALLLSGSGLAQTAYGSSISTDNPSWYLAPSLNMMDPDNRFGTDRRGEGVGLRLGVPVAPNWDIQFGPTFSRAHDGDFHYRQNTLGLDALYLFSREQLRPFLLAGGGAEYDRVSNSLGRSQRTSPYVNLGLGVQYLFSDQWGMQADWRRARGFLRGNQFNFNRATTDTLTLGLVYVFDKPPIRQARSQPMEAMPAQAPVAVALAPAPAPPPPPPRFERYSLSSTELFAFDSSELASAQPKLDEIANALSRNGQIEHVAIVGYTDRLGSDDYNQRLSLRRAEAVKAYLVSRGVESGRLTASGQGESNPVVTCNDPQRKDLIQCLEPNRRVESEQIVIQRQTQ